MRKPRFSLLHASMGSMVTHVRRVGWPYMYQYTYSYTVLDTMIDNTCICILLYIPTTTYGHNCVVCNTAVTPVAGQDRFSEWQDSTVRHQAGQGSLHPLDWHLSAAVCCLGSAGPQPAACGRRSGHDMASPPHSCSPLPLLQGQHLLHHLPACRYVRLGSVAMFGQQVQFGNVAMFCQQVQIWECYHHVSPAGYTNMRRHVACSG